MIKTKTYKIGEYARGGIITVMITGKVIQISALDYFSKEVVSHRTTDKTDEDWYWKCRDYLEDLTTHYYADKILTWIEKSLGEPHKVRFR